MMFMTERFMASAMSLVRIAPDAPTRAPAMIRTGLSMTKPAIATAVPVNEFSRLDDDRHVGAADRQRHRDRRRSAAREPRITSIERPRFGVPADEQDDGAATTVTTASARVTSRPPGIVDRLAGDEALELAATR